MNPTFASGRTGWVASPNVIAASAGSEAGYDKGSDFAWLDGYSTPHTDTLSQTVTLPRSAVPTRSPTISRSTRPRRTSGVDTLTMQVLASNGTSLYSTTVSNLNAPAPGPAPSYSGVSIPLTSSIAGQQTITLKFTGAETNAGGGTTDFLLDDWRSP